MPEGPVFEFQKQWRTSVGAPLDWSTPGQVLVPEKDYDPDLCANIRTIQGLGPIDRLGAYRRQYWFRLVTLLQEDFPLLGHVLGWSEFNVLAEQYLRKFPSNGNLQDLGVHFARFLRERQMSVDWIEAVRVDLAWARIFGAELSRPLDEVALQQVASGEAELMLSSSVRVLDLQRDWCRLRVALTSGEDVAAGLPDLQPQIWVVSRQGSVIHAQPVSSDLARILEAMRRGSSWLAALEYSLTQNPSLESHVQAWFAQGVPLGWWSVTTDSDI